MPIFNNDITFIHIPKSGGTSIEKFLQSKGMKMSLFTDNGYPLINGHTPQHCTFMELQSLNLLTDKIFTIWRSEIDRVISEYFYVKKYREDLNKLFTDFDEFLDVFLDKKNELLFDHHNLSNRDFLKNESGEIDERITIIDFFEVKKIEDFVGYTGLNNFKEMKTTKDIEINHLQIKKIKDFYQC